jgi:hypothetical protein
VLAAPGSTPGLTIPGHGAMSQMNHMRQPSKMGRMGS